MRPSSCFLVAAGLAAAVLAGCHATQAYAQEPPAKPWTPPKTALPKEMVDAAAFLLKHGLGDPRGGEPVEAMVPGDSPWDGGGQAVAMKGWLLPAEGKAPRKFVGVDGLVYVPISVKGPITTEEIVKPSPQSGPMFATKSMMPTMRGGSQLVAVLLLQHGEVAAAEKLVQPPGPGFEGWPLYALANEYLTARFHRAIAAHMRGDDALAYADSMALKRDRDAYEKEGLKSLGPQWVQRMTDVQPKPPTPVRAFPYLEPIDRLAEDSKRRLDNPRPLHADMAAIAKLPTDKRIAALIDALDSVDARQWGQPGGVSLGTDSIVAALVKEGNAAGDPLLDCIEHDKRLTRAVSFGRDFFPSRNVIEVRDAALAAFQEIAQVYQITPYGEPVSIAELRKFWTEMRDLTPPERWMRRLDDDKLDARRWLEAASLIVEPSNVHRMGAWMTTNTLTKTPPAMKGEVLRSKRGPSVSDLIAKRALQVAQVDHADLDTHEFEIGWGLELALQLAKWDAKEAVPTLQAVSRRAMAEPLQPNRGNMVGWYGRHLAKAIERRYAAGDASALSEYADWLPQLSPRDTMSNGVLVFYPAVKHRNDPAIRQAIRKMFGDPGSPWSLRGMALDKQGGMSFEWLVSTPILQIPEIRHEVIAMLNDRTVIGKSWREGSSTMVAVGSGTVGYGGGGPSVDPLAPPKGQKRDYRLGDSVAFVLRRLKKAPKFEPYWPDAAKDRAIAQLVALFKGSGDWPMDGRYNLEWQLMENPALP